MTPGAGERRVRFVGDALTFTLSHTRARTLRLNTDLAKKPRECLEYLVVHELAHLLEPTHNARFIALMNQFLPNWQSRRQSLNRLPVRHERWGY